MLLCKCHTFWMVPCSICYFIVILFHIEKKWLPMINLATILPLKSKFSGKLQRFNATDTSIEMQECSFWTSRNSALQMFFLTPNRKMFAGKFVKWESFLAVFRKHIVFYVMWVEVRKTSEGFRAKLYCKMSDLFC